MRVFVLASAVTCALASSGASVERHLAAAAANDGANPIRKVVTLLEKMAKKVEAEGEKESQLYKEFSCYCKTGGGELAQSIAENEAKVPQTASDIESSEAELVQIKADLKSHQEDRTAAKAASEAAAAQREKENAAYSETSSELKTYVSALTAAITAINKGMAGGFLQAARGVQSSGAMLVQKALVASTTVTDMDRSMVATFLESAGTGKATDSYVPKGGEVVGIMNQIKEDFEKNLADVESAEADAVKIHEELIAAKAKQVASLSDAIEKKTVRQGDLGIEIVNLKNSLGDAEAALLDDKKMKADLTSSCDSKAAEWDERVKTRADEVVAIRETIGILNSDDALDLFKKTLPSPSLLQVRDASSKQRMQVLDAIRHQRDNASDNDQAIRLDLLATALSGRKVDFSKVVKMIDDMISLLKKEQVDDESKQEYCGKQLDTTEDKVKELTNKGEDLSATVAEQEEMIASLTADLKSLKEGIEALDKNVMEAAEQRKKENEEFVELTASNNAATELIGYAKTRLQKFYQPKLYAATTTVAPPTEEPAAFIQVQMHSQQQPSTPPATWDAYATKGEDSAGVMSYLDLLVRDLEKETTEATANEKNAQKDYESMTQDAAAKRSANLKTISAAESSKADSEAARETATESGATVEKEKQATTMYQMQLHKECDWLMQNFDLRKDARASEVDNLNQAKAVLAGADFAFSQK